MMYKLELSNEAEEDIVIATDYYSEQSDGLGVRFLKEVYIILDKIAEHPTYYKYLSGKGNKHFRYTRIKGFPFIVIFRIDDKNIIVSAVHNTWKDDKRQD